MELTTPLLLSVLTLILGYIAYTLARPKENSSVLLLRQIESMSKQISEGLSSAAAATNNQISQISSTVNRQLHSMNMQMRASDGQIGMRLDKAAQVTGEVRQNLGELGKSAEKIYEIGKDISSLHNILRAPKARGIMGELFLGDLLAQILPAAHYTMQHRFKSGEIVDAVVRLSHGLVPVDSKFPLENFERMTGCNTEEESKGFRKKFNQDVKRHIDAIAAKYILPDEGTFDFAMMYIPAENVYYEAIPTLTSYALSKRVIPASPGSFYAYLQTIVLGLKGLHIEKSAREIHDNIQRLQADFIRILEDFEVVGKHMTNTRSRYEELSKRLSRFSDRLKSASNL